MREKKIVVNKEVSIKLFMKSLNRVGLELVLYDDDGGEYYT